ncbi:MAG: DUF167 domain-containing protein [Gemmatimonadetes bacterium]|nr:DUF167 domain-containing protein [Gemmatimonadota bacterium]
MLAISAGAGPTIRFAVHVQPRATRSEVVGCHGDALRVRLQAPPVDGAANEALVELLADTLEVPRRAIALVAGHTARRKVVEVPEDARARLMALATG